MEIIKTSIDGVVEIQPKVWGDDRGYFFESFNQSIFDKIVPNTQFVQDNQSFSVKGVLRGIHFQKPPFTQGKLVRVLSGRVIDVAVDLRKNSLTYGQHVALELSAEKNNMLYVPEGFAHGFYTLEDATFFYKCTNLYNKESEGGVMWNDESLAIDWKLDGKPVVSDKDQVLPLISELDDIFTL